MPAPRLSGTLSAAAASDRLAALAAACRLAAPAVARIWNLTVPATWTLHEERPVDDLRLHIVKGGHASYSLDGASIDLHRGVILLLHPRLRFRHAVDPRDPLVLMSVHWRLPALDADGPGWWLAADARDAAGAWSELADELYQAQAGADACDRAQAVPVLLALALLRLRRLCQAQDGGAFDVRVEALRDHLQRHPEDIRPLSELAARQGLSGDHLARLFRRQVGQSPQQYRLRMAMERARVLLEQTGMSVRAVAERFGYADQFVFSRLFRRVHGRPPSAFHARRQSV